MTVSPQNCVLQNLQAHQPCTVVMQYGKEKVTFTLQERSPEEITRIFLSHVNQMLQGPKVPSLGIVITKSEDVVYQAMYNPRDPHNFRSEPLEN